MAQSTFAHLFTSPQLKSLQQCVYDFIDSYLETDTSDEDYHLRVRKLYSTQIFLPRRFTHIRKLLIAKFVSFVKKRSYCERLRLRRRIFLQDFEWLRFKFCQTLMFYVKQRAITKADLRHIIRLCDCDLYESVDTMSLFDWLVIDSHLVDMLEA